MKSGAIGAVPPLAERHDVAKTWWRKRFFGNRVVRGETRREWPFWGRRGEVAGPGLESGVLRPWGHGVDELTDVTGCEGTGFHTPHASQSQKIVGNRRRHLRKISTKGATNSLSLYE